MSEQKLYDDGGTPFLVDNKWYYDTLNFGRRGPFDTKDAAWKDTIQYDHWLAAMDAN